MMPIPQVETFESDITEEIKQKQGRVTDTLAAHSSAPPKTPDQGIIRAIISLIIILLISLIAGVWYYFSITKQQATEKIAEQKAAIPIKHPVMLNTILPKTSSNIERYVVHVSKENAGYIIKINDYASVYGSLLSNETLFGNELTKLFQIDTQSTPIFKDVTINNQDMRVAALIVASTGTSTEATTTIGGVPTIIPQTVLDPKQSTTSISTTTKTTSKATSTKATSTPSLKGTSTTQLLIVTTSTPVTESILDRNASYDYVSYGFVGTSTLLISTSQSKMLELRSVIIK